MERFIKEIEKKVGSPESAEDIEKYENYRVIFRNITGREMEENDVMYDSFGSLNRSIINIFASEPKTIGKRVVYSEPVDGCYEINLVYIEG